MDNGFEYSQYHPPHSPTRPICPKCAYDLVFVALAIGEHVVESWLCDCGGQIQPIRDAVTMAREDSPESAGVVSFS